MRRSLWLLVLLAGTAHKASGQACTHTVLVSFYDQLTTSEIETLKSDDIEVRMAGTTLPVVKLDRDFNNRVLILLETDGASKSSKLEETVDTVTQQARTMGEGRPVAFGIYAQKAVFTKGFVADPDQRNTAVGQVMEEAGTLGSRVALWDALHDALALFGPHQPGDTILLVGEPYDDASHHSAHDVEREFVSSGTRLFIMRRIRGSRVDRDFMWSSHELEKATLDRITQETGGLLSEYVPSLIRFAWAGYMVEIRMPEGMDKPRKWKVQFRGPAAQTHRKTNFYYPAVLPPCSVKQESRQASR